MTIRENIESAATARTAFMADRLARHHAEVEAEGLRDMRALYLQSTRDERSAGEMTGLLFLAVLVALGALLGYASAEWWTGGEGLAHALSCLRGPQ